jgi:hypothetical protein
VICSDNIDGAIETLASGDIASLGMGEIMPSCTFKEATLGASVATVFVAKEGLLLVVGAAETLIATEGLLVVCSDKIDGVIETLASGDITSLGMGEIMPSCTFKVATLGASVATVFVAKEGLLLVVGAAEAGVVPVEASSSS